MQETLSIRFWDKTKSGHILGEKATKDGVCCSQVAHCHACDAGADLKLPFIVKLRPEAWQFSLQLLDAVASEAGHAFHKLLLAEFTHGSCSKVPAQHQHDWVFWAHLDSSLGHEERLCKCLPVLAQSRLRRALACKVLPNNNLHT